MHITTEVEVVEADSEAECVPVEAWLDIRRNSDGLVRRDADTWDFYGDYIWGDGNFACDCNRAMFFARAGDEQDDDDVPCGDSAYSVRLVGLGGEVLYQDDDW